MYAYLRNTALAGTCCLNLIALPCLGETRGWTQPALESPDPPGTCSASGFGLAPDNVTISLFLDKARPGTLVLTLNMWNDPDKTDLSAIPARATITLADGTLDLRGLVRRSANLPDEFTADVDAVVVPSLLHGLTAGSTPPTAGITGRAIPQRINPQGSSKAIDRMQRCIQSKGFASAPAPFRGLSTNQQHDVPGCLRYGDDVTLAGTLVKRSQSVNGEDTVIQELRLNSPVCVYRYNLTQPFQAAVGVLLLEAPNAMTFAPPQQAYGRPMQVTGRLREAESKYDVDPNVLTMTPNRR